MLAGPAFPQKTETDKAAEQQNREAAPGDTPAVLEIKPGSPTIKTKDITEQKKVKPWERIPRYLAQDQMAIWTSPFHTNKANAKWWAIFGGATAALIATDRWSSRQLPNTQDQLTVATWTSRFGGSYFLLPASGAFYFIGLGAKNQRFRETGILGFEALADTALVVGLLKVAVNRERPLEGSSGGSFWSGQARPWDSSFPSGHAVSSWALASIVAHEYPHPRIVPVLAYGLAGTVIGSRFAARRHFASDVVVGAAMGWFIGDYIFAKRHNRELEKAPALERAMGHFHLGGPLQPYMPPDADAARSDALRRDWLR
jgi:membrane-associated phospholipid phosphatase